MGIRVPQFTYEGGTADAYSGNQYWYIICKSSDKENGATLTFKYDKTVDIFLVGSGGAGGSGNGASGGGGGEVLTVRGVKLSKDVGYKIRIGEGGKGAIWANGGDGERTSFRLNSSKTYIANGGKGGKVLTGATNDVGAPGGSGGSGGGAGTYIKGEKGGDGGVNGASGGSTTAQTAVGGSGKGGTTVGFGKAIGGNHDGVVTPSGTPRPYAIFAGGGGGSARNEDGGKGGAGTDIFNGGGGHGGGEPDGVTNEAGGDGLANSGGGGGGSSGHGDETPRGGNGGSGIIIIRSTMPDYLPVYFNGTRLTDIYYQIGNGGTKHKLDTLTFNGTKLY